MRRYLHDSSGISGLRVAKAAIPRCGPGDALVEVRAVSLNYRDLMVVQGRYGRRHEEPMVPCSDASGVVAAVGEGVDGVKPGDAVVVSPFVGWQGGRFRREYLSGFLGGGAVPGVLAEQLVVPAAALVQIPDGYTFEEASTLPIAGLTAWTTLVCFARLRAGEWVLAHGTGGVSIFAAQLAKAMGARVFLTSSNARKATLARERFGVDATSNWRDETWTDAVLEATGGAGVDVVVETAGGEGFAQSIAVSAYGARLGIVGVLGGQEVTMDSIRVLSRQLVVGGIYVGPTEELRALVRALPALGIKPCVDCVFRFEEAVEAYRYLEAQQHFGKVVISVGG